VVLIQHLIGNNYFKAKNLQKKKEKAPSLLLGGQQNAIILKTRINKRYKKLILSKS